MVYFVVWCELSVVCCIWCVLFFKQKTAYEMRISDWSSDVCSSDLMQGLARPVAQPAQNARRDRLLRAAKHQAALAKHHPPGRQGRPVNTNIRSLKGENRALDKGNTIR